MFLMTPLARPRQMTPLGIGLGWLLERLQEVQLALYSF
jgi:hypothetical protein